MNELDNKINLTELEKQEKYKDDIVQCSAVEITNNIMKSLLNRRMLGVVRDDPSCIKCGTRFPQGFRRIVNGYIYKTEKEIRYKDGRLGSSFN